MSQSFKFKYDEMRENDPAGNNSNTNEGFSDGAFYPSSGSVRNVCFVFLDGKRLFLNYAYLVSGEYNPEENMILLAFTTHAVALKGIRLETLYNQFIQQLNKIVACVDERYNDLQGETSSVVNHIVITNN
jgi:hypothetical protein